jgi:FkbM family methyltransferase
VIFNNEGYAYPDYQKTDARLWKNLYFPGPAERDQWETVLKLTRKRDFAIDFGGHVGGSALKFASQFKKVVSFEPVPALFECLEENTKNNDQIEIHNVGISDIEGTATIWVNKQNPGSNVIENHQTKTLIESRWKNPRRKEQFDETQQIIINTRTIDSYEFEDVDFIKMDTEGYIMQPLYGMTETLKRCKPLLQIERSWEGGKSEQSNYLQSLGYRYNTTIDQDDFFI